MAKTRKRSEFHTLKIILVRHGQAGGEVRLGEVGAPLTQLGEKQATRVAKRLSEERFEHNYTNDMSRAFHTAKAIREFHKRRPFTVTKEIQEINGSMNLPGRAPEGKVVQEEIRKRRTGIEKFAKDLIKKHRWDDQILIVAHGNLIRHLVSVLADLNPKRSLRFETSNTSMNEVRFLNGKFLWLQRTNDLRHLLPRQVS